jgi:hypothetical protein
MPSNETNGGVGSPVVRGITTLVGWLAGIATLAYVAGVLIYAIRLRVHGASVGLAPASALPRELLVATSLTSVGLPLLVLGGTYYLYRVGMGVGPDPRTMRSRIARAKSETGHIRSWLSLGVEVLFALVISSSVLVIIWRLTRYRTEAVGLEPTFYVAVGLIAFTTLLLAIVAREIVLFEFDTPDKFNRNSIRVLLMLIYVGALLPGLIAIAGVLPLPQVNVCGDDPKLDRSGLLIGFTSDRIYIAQRLGPGGESEGQELGLVDAISLDAVVETYVGRNARNATCQYETAASPSPGP